MIVAALLLAAATPSSDQRDHSNYEEAVQEQIDNLPDGDQKDELQDKLNSYESDENYPDDLKGDRERISDEIEECDDCVDPNDAGEPD